MKFVPCLLTAEQKDDRVSVCTDLHEWAHNNPNFMSSVITGEECWVYGYDPETKQMSSRWNTASSPWPKKAWQVKSTVHHEYTPKWQMVNKEFYKTVLQCLCDVRRQRHEKWRSGNWILHHDNAPAHRAVTINEFLANTIFRRPHTLPTPLTLLPATSSCSRNWRKQWKVTDSITLKRFKPVWRYNWGLVQKVTTRGAFVSGRNTGISAYKHKDTTLKETRPTSPYVYSFTHKQISPGIKWSAHVSL